MRPKRRISKGLLAISTFLQLTLVFGVPEGKGASDTAPPDLSLETECQTLQASMRSLDLLEEATAKLHLAQGELRGACEAGSVSACPIVESIQLGAASRIQADIQSLQRLQAKTKVRIDRSLEVEGRVPQIPSAAVDSSGAFAVECRRLLDTEAGTSGPEPVDSQAAGHEEIIVPHWNWRLEKGENIHYEITCAWMSTQKDTEIGRVVRNAWNAKEFAEQMVIINNCTTEDPNRKGILSIRTLERTTSGPKELDTVTSKP
jgi:hypothetical protein